MAKKMTKRDRMIRFFTEGLNKKEVNKTTGGKIKFTGREAGHFYFVTRGGAVRSGRTIGESVSITRLVEKNMKLWEEKEGRSK